MSAISVFQVKFTVQLTSWAMNFSWIARVLKENKSSASERNREKKPFQSQLSKPANRNHGKIINHRRTSSWCDRSLGNFVSSRSKKSFITVLYCTLSQRKSSFTFWFFRIETRQLGLEQESAKHGNQERSNFKQDLQQITCTCLKQTSENTS